jgi:excisionase family DNA binding protein
MTEEQAGPPPTFVGIAEARRLLGGCSRSSVYRWIEGGRLRAVKRGRRTLVDVASIERFLASLPDAKIGTGGGGSDNVPPSRECFAAT